MFFHCHLPESCMLKLDGKAMAFELRVGMGEAPAGRDHFESIFRALSFPSASANLR